MTAEERAQAARAYLDVLRQIELCARALREPRTFWLRPVTRIRQRRTLGVLAQAQTAASRLESAMVDLGVGACEAWGLLSVLPLLPQVSNLPRPPRNVEEVLRGALYEQAGALLSLLARARAHTELSMGALALVQAEAEIGALVSRHAGLRDFLPVHARPPVANADELQRRTSLLTLEVNEDSGTSDTPYRFIRLSGIVSRARGYGVGTAALQELCAYADRAMLPIIATFGPGFDFDDKDAVRLAHWYHRHGFRQGTRRPDEWIDRDKMWREPVPI